MAGLDYCCCNKCGIRLFFDGDRTARSFMEEEGQDFIVCSKCYKKLLKRIETLEKAKKRGN